MRMDIIMQTNSITGRQLPLIAPLREDLVKANAVYINVAFLMESGVKLILPQLTRLAQRNVPIKILTGTYLSVTEPSAIYLLKVILGNKVDIRFYNERNVSFHPKGYIIEQDGDSIAYIGSSNVSQSALISGIEWNYRLQKSSAPNDFQAFLDMFNLLFDYHSDVVTDEVLSSYSQSWRKTIFNTTPKQEDEEKSITPQGVQHEALYYLKEARDEGITKGLVVAATGVGKTFLAAFDSFKFKKVLFIAHKEEILKQAAESFSKVRPKDGIGFFYGTTKNRDKDMIFATVQTLGQERYLCDEYFAPDAFDYIVIDEFHHAAANSYQKLLQYFTPTFLLGLTATPFRMDNRDILHLCDDNVIYEIYLRDSINRGYLVPFQYYAFYDDTDYNQIEHRSGTYNLEQLESMLSHVNRADLILIKFKQYAGTKTIAFCVGIKHAEYMADFFGENGIKVAVVHSGHATSKNFMSRDKAIEALEKGSIKVIFVVDLFNEGVDIPSIDTVLFLRPTESYVIFIQQLGRGLRKFENKGALKVLDFIGNYKRAHHIPMLLSGENPLQEKKGKGTSYTDIQYPDGCQVNFDFRLIDLFTEMRKHDPLQTRMKDEFYRLQAELERCPTRLDIFEGCDIELTHFLQEGGWLGFLKQVDELTAEEEVWLTNEVKDFLREIERTVMTKSYKIPTLLCFIEKDVWIMNVTVERLQKVWADYYRKPVHAKDMLRDKSTKKWREWEKDELSKLAIKNPVKYLAKSTFFHYDEINKVFSIKESLQAYLTPELARHFHDILTWRSLQYFAKRYGKE